jgi:hypothetical protein
MSRNSRYDRLFKVDRVHVFSYLLGGVISIHEWHVTIHENKVVLAVKTSIHQDVLFNSVYCLLAVVGVVASVYVLKVAAIFDYYLDCFNIILLVVND